MCARAHEGAMTSDVKRMAREARLLELLRLVRSVGPAGTDLRRAVAIAERSFRVSERTAKDYLDDLRIRGWIKVAYGNVRITPSGEAEVEGLFERQKREAIA